MIAISGVAGNRWLQTLLIVESTRVQASKEIITRGSGNFEVVAPCDQVPMDPREANRVWRAQIEITVADIANAGTDDTVFVSLNKNNYTRLDYARDDFKRGDTFTYDLLLDNVARLANITELSVGRQVDKNDSLRLSGFRLLINGQTIFVYSGDLNFNNRTALSDHTTIS